MASEMFKQRVIMGREGAGTVFPGPLNSLDADADTAAENINKQQKGKQRRQQEKARQTPQAAN